MLEQMLETSARLLRLLSLFQGRRYWSGADLSARLEVTARTLRRDVDKLRSLGYPIHSTSGIEGGYQLGAGSTMPPLLLDDEEAIAVVLGLRCAAGGAVGGLEETAVRALSKIEQILPPRLRRRAAALHGMIVTTPGVSPAVNAMLLSTIAGACRDLQTLRFRYEDREGKPSARLVEPYRLVHTGKRWYLVAWDTDRTDWRTFRVDRMQPRVAAGARFVPRDPPARDLAAYVTQGMWASPPCRARVKLFTSAESVADRVRYWGGALEPVDASTCWYELGEASWESIAMHLAFVGYDFEISGPPELAAAVEKMAERYRRATAGVCYENRFKEGL
jgi:predicted DNA-binding transcriptional regulator YafY